MEPIINVNITLTIQIKHITKTNKIVSAKPKLFTESLTVIEYKIHENVRKCAQHIKKYQI